MPLPRAGRGRGRRRRRGGNGSGEERSRSSCQGDEEHEEMPAIPQVMQKPNLYRFQSKPVAPPWQPSGGCLDLSLGSRVWERSRRDWGRTFAIRLDLHGCFHTYPDAGGPFQNLQEADKAIHRYLEARRDPKMCVEEGAGSSMERIVRKALYWPDGTIKKRTRSNAVKKTKERMCQVVQALVDKYNEDHNLLEDDAHKLKDFLVYVSIHEKGNLYYHLNFTTNKGASMDNLIFAEVLVMAQDQHSELVVSCFCTVNLDDNGQHCYGCTKRGHKYMKHPDDSVEFFAGHLNVPLPFGAFREWSDSDGDDAKYMKAKEAKVRRMYKGLDDPATFKRLFTLPPGVTLVGV